MLFYQRIFYLYFTHVLSYLWRVYLLLLEYTSSKASTNPKFLLISYKTLNWNLLSLPSMSHLQISSQIFYNNYWVVILTQQEDSLTCNVMKQCSFTKHKTEAATKTWLFINTNSMHSHDLMHLKKFHLRSMQESKQYTCSELSNITAIVQHNLKIMKILSWTLLPKLLYHQISNQRPNIILKTYTFLAPQPRFRRNTTFFLPNLSYAF